MSRHITLRGVSWELFWLFAFAMFGAGFFWPQKAQADDWFWYVYPSPQSYLYVEDPIQYRTWEAQYGERSVTVPGADVRFPFTETIYFGFNSCTVDQPYFEAIETAADLIAENEAIAVVNGHTDVRGGVDVNVQFGLCRVSAVADLLRAFGIPTMQLNQVSHGAERLAIDNAETEAEHAVNRRVTIDFTVVTPGKEATSTERARIAGKWERRDYLGLWR